MPSPDSSVDQLLKAALLASLPKQRQARSAIRRQAQAQGIWLASILPLYQARATVTMAFTVPAMNVRGLGYDFCRAILRCARRQKVGAFIIEVARSEMAYTEQPADDVAVMALAAALAEGYTGPLFLQGDHYQVSREAPEADRAALKDLIGASLQAGFYNLDIDASTLVDFSQPTTDEQQARNAEYTADLVRFIRQRQPLPVAIGGEIGEIGGRISTLADLHGFMRGLQDRLAGMPGICKVAVQTGTSHGGILNPDGSVKSVRVDLSALQELSQVARRDYGLAGAVQHGASTLPDDMFGEFPKAGCAEIHLSTEFQNIILDHPAFPTEITKAMNVFVTERFSGARTPDQTEAQFFRKYRKQAWGHVRRQLADLPLAVREQIGAALEEKVAQLFSRLQVVNTRQAVDQFVRPPRL